MREMIRTNDKSNRNNDEEEIGCTNARAAMSLERAPPTHPLIVGIFVRIFFSPWRDGKEGVEARKRKCTESRR